VIYDAFQIEAEKRQGRSIEEWQEAERQAVLNAATVAATQMGLRAPTLADVVAAEQYACGSVDYGAKWAYGVVDRMVDHARS